MPLPQPIARLVAGLADAHERHRERHRPTGCRFAIADRLGLLDPGAWDAATAQASVLLRRPYLTALDLAAPAEVAHRFALIADAGDRPLAAVVCQVVALDGRRLHAAAQDQQPARPAGEAPRAASPAAAVGNAVARGSAALRAGAARAAVRLRGAALDRVRLRALVCGNLWTWGRHGVALAPGADPARAWPAVGEALYRIRRAEALSGAPDVVLVKDLPAGEDLPGLRRLSYRPVATEPDMVLALRSGWRGFDDYLAALNAKYRKMARDTVAQVAAAGFTVAALDDLAPEAEAIHALYRQVHARAAVRPLCTTAAYLPAAARALRSTGFRCTAVRRGTDLVGFVTTIRDGATAIAYQVGFDEAANAAAPIYFRLLYAAIADAIALGCARVSFGRTALEVKARLGARPEPLALWTRHRRQPLNVLVRPLLGLVKHAEAPERSPFKG